MGTGDRGLWLRRTTPVGRTEDRSEPCSRRQVRSHAYLMTEGLSVATQQEIHAHRARKADEEFSEVYTELREREAPAVHLPHGGCGGPLTRPPKYLSLSLRTLEMEIEEGRKNCSVNEQKCDFLIFFNELVLLVGVRKIEVPTEKATKSRKNRIDRNRLGQQYYVNDTGHLRWKSK